MLVLLADCFALFGRAMWESREVELGLYRLDFADYMSTLWAAVEDWVVVKQERTATGKRMENWLMVHGVHIASLYTFIFQSKLQRLLFESKLIIVSLNYLLLFCLCICLDVYRD